MAEAEEQLTELAREEPSEEARRDIERLAANAERDREALAAGDPFGGGDPGLMGEIVIKWADRGVSCP